MAKSIWDQLGDIAGGAVNNIGNFLGTAAGDVGNFVGGAEKNIGQMFSGGAPQAPTPAAQPGPVAPPMMNGGQPQMPWANPSVISSMNPNLPTSPFQAPAPAPLAPQQQQKKPTNPTVIPKSSGSTDPKAIASDFNNIDKFQPADQIGLIQRAYRAGMMHPADMTTAINQIIDGETAKANAPTQDPGTGNWLLDQATGLGNGLVKTGSTVGDIGAEIISSLTHNKDNLAAAKQQFNEDAPQSLPGGIEHGFEQFAAPAGAALAGNDLLNKGYDAGDVKNAMDAQTANTGVSTDSSAASNALKIASGAAQTALTMATLSSPVYGKTASDLGAAIGRVLDGGAVAEHIAAAAKASGNSLLKESLKAGLNQAAIGGVNGIVSTFGQDKFNAGDFIKNALGGAIGGEVLGTVTPYASAGLSRVLHSPDALVHEQLMHTNPDYAEAASNSYLLAQKIKQTKDPDVKAQLTDVKTTLDANLQRTRHQTLQSGFHAVPGAGDSDKQILHATVAQYKSHDDYVNQAVDRIWQNNKKGAGTAIVHNHLDETGVGSDAFQGTRVSNNNPYYRAKFEETGRAPTKAGIKQDVIDFLDGKDNAAKYELHPDERGVADLLKQRDAGDKVLAEKGTDPNAAITKKVNLINGKRYKSPKMNEYQQAAYASPEFKAHSEAGRAHDLAKQEYLNHMDTVKVYDKKMKSLRTHNRSQDAVDAFDPTVHLKKVQLERQLEATAKKYGETTDAFHKAYPNANFDSHAKARIKRQQLTILDKKALDAEQNNYLNQPTNHYTLGKSDEPVTATPAGKSKVLTIKAKEPSATVTAKASNEASRQKAPRKKSNADDIAATLGLSEKDKTLAPTEHLSQEMEDATTLPKSAKQLQKDGDTAIFNKIREDGTIQEAIDEYKKVTGATDEEANKRVQKIIDSGAGMADKEAVMKRNPQYKQIPDAEAPRSVKEAEAQVRTHTDIANRMNDTFQKGFKKLDAHDQAAMDDLRGKTPEQVIKDNKVHDPERFLEVAGLNQDLHDYLHEYGRINGADTLYRENYGAGLHTNIPEGEERLDSEPIPQSNLNKPISSSYHRYTTGYDELAGKYGRDRMHDNFAEDVAHDTKQSIGYARQREMQRLLQKTYGTEAVAYGPPKESDTNLTTHKLDNDRYHKLYTTKAIADEYNQLHPTVKKSGKVMTVVKKGVNAANSAVVQSTVYNPFIHGQNLIWQAVQAAGASSKVGVLGLGRSLRSMVQLMKDPEGLQALRDDYKMHGGHIDFDNRQPGWINKITDGKGRSLSDANKRALFEIDQMARLSNYKNMIENGMSKREAIARIDNYLGDDKQMGQAANIVGFFLKWFKTQAVSLMTMVRHPIRDMGAIQNLVLLTAGWYAVNTAIQGNTNNKNSYWRAPGNLGLIKEIVNGVIGASQGDNGKAFGQAALNHLNPLIKEGIQQATNYDFFTQKKITDNGGSRSSHAVNTLMNPASQNTSLQSGKKSAAELALNAGLGVYTPHAKGNVATTNPALAGLNTQGATVAPGKDPTGYTQQQTFFRTTDAAEKSLDTTQQNLYNQETSTEKDKNGNPVPKKEDQAQSDALALAADYNSNKGHSVLEAITKQKRDQAAQDGTPLDPLYSDKLSDGTTITNAMRAEYERMKGSPYKGDDYTQLGDANPWMKTLATDRAAFYAANPINAASASPSDLVPTPQFDQPTEDAMNTAASLDGQAKYDYMAKHPEVQAAYDKISQYTNDRRVAQGYAPFKLYPKADPDTRAVMIEFQDLAQHNGSKGGSPDVAKWIQANPDKYAKIQDYFTQTSEWELANSAGKDKYVGATPNQQELKSAYSLGQYDIAKTVSPAGVTSYSLNPAAAYAQKSGSSSKSYHSYKSYAASNAQYKMNKFMKYGLAQSRKNVTLRVKKPKLLRGLPKTATMHVTGSQTGSSRLRIRSKNLSI